MITMDSILDDFKNGKHIFATLKSFATENPQHQLAHGLFKIHNSYEEENTIKLNEILAEINKIDYTKYSIEEQLLFLNDLCNFLRDKKKSEKAISILSTIKRLTTHGLSPEWQIIPIAQEGFIYGMEGNYKKKIEAVERCLQILDTKSERYHNSFWVLLSILVLTNDLERFDKEFIRFKKNYVGTPYNDRVEYLLLLSNIERGNFLEIENLVKKVRENNPAFVRNLDLIICEKLFQLFIKNNDKDLDEKNSFDWLLLSTACLLKKDIEKSLYWAHKSAEEYIDFKMEPSFFSYCLIRAELANKNINAAIYSLESRSKINNTCLFDDFFWFRIYHIKGDINRAQHYFNTFVVQVEKFKLDNRFDIELKLSPEISFTDIRNYSRNINSPIKIQNLQKPQIKENDEAAFDFIVGESKAISQVINLIKKYAELETTILIIGETGTGKELVAKALWQSGSYKTKPYIPINCGAISDHLLQSELFGHKKGAFTGAFENHKGVFEEAGEGIVFLDEIGEISPAMQVNLLRILEAREFRAVGSNENKKLNCKIIAATNRNLVEHVKTGNFRQDLQYRLEKLTIEIPTLRERISDIPILINHFLNVENPQLPPIFFDEPSMQFLMALPWPGNIRELRNEMERIRLFYSDKKNLTIAELSNKYQVKKSTTLPGNTPVSIPTPIVVLKHETSEINESLLNLNSKFRRLEELKNLFVKHAKLSRIEVEDLLKVSPNTAVTYLNILEKENYICKKTFANSKTHYYEIIR